MLNLEELYIKILEILDFDMKNSKLKHTVEKKRFLTKEESYKKYQEHIKLIFETLALDKYNPELINIFSELISLYEKIRKELVNRKYENNNNTKKLNWIILKRLVVPFLAYKLAQLDSRYENRIDKNMPGGLFWYLPDIKDLQNIKMSIPFLIDWWLDLYGKGLDSLCNDIDENSSENPALNLFNPWRYKGILPNKKSLELYLNKDIEYNGVFQSNIKESLNEQFEQAKAFIEKKKLTIEELKEEVPEPSLLDVIFVDKLDINDDGKKRFIEIISDRWQKPTKESLFTKFWMGRVSQDIYGRLIEYLEFDEKSTDIEENKLLQLIYQFEILYNLQIDRQDKNDSNYDLGDLDIGYEMLTPFYQCNEEIINTIGGDISIELINPSVDTLELEDNYKVKILIFIKEEDERVVKAVEEDKKFHEYLHKQHDEVDRKIKEENIEEETDFRVLINLYNQYQFSDYSKAEKICSRMSKVSKQLDENRITIEKLLGLYCAVKMINNENKAIEAKQLLSLYKTMYVPYDILIFLEAGFHLKSEEFEKSLYFYNEYYDKFIHEKKKEERFTDIVYLAAYCADIQKDKKKLKKYNRYLKNQDPKLFESKKSLPFSIYFYK